MLGRPFFAKFCTALDAKRVRQQPRFLAKNEPAPCLWGIKKKTQYLWVSSVLGLTKFVGLLVDLGCRQCTAGMDDDTVPEDCFLPLCQNQI